MIVNCIVNLVQYQVLVDHGTDGLWWYYCNTTTPLSSQQHPLRIMLDVCGGTLPCVGESVGGFSSPPALCVYCDLG
jgi:hypothetical protein